MRKRGGKYPRRRLARPPNGAIPGLGASESIVLDSAEVSPERSESHPHLAPTDGGLKANLEGKGVSAIKPDSFIQARCDYVTTSKYASQPEGGVKGPIVILDSDEELGKGELADVGTEGVRRVTKLNTNHLVATVENGERSISYGSPMNGGIDAEGSEALKVRGGLIPSLVGKPNLSPGGVPTRGELLIGLAAISNPSPPSKWTQSPEAQRLSPESARQALGQAKRQKVQVLVPGQVYDEAGAVYRPRFVVHPAKHLRLVGGLFDHCGHPFRFQGTGGSACEALDQLEAKLERIPGHSLAGYLLREFDITSLNGEPAEPFLFENLQQGMSFSGVVYGRTKAAFVTGGKLLGVYALRPDAKHFAVEVYAESATHPNLHLLLRKPSPAYRFLYRGFLWYAILVRNIVDWASEVGEVTFAMLRSDLKLWLEARYRMDPQYQAWKAEISTGGDYRHYIANARLLLAKHLAKEEVGHGLLEVFLVSGVKVPKTAGGFEKTLVTPKVYHWFKSCFGNHLYTLDPKPMAPPPEVPAPNLPDETWSMEDARILETQDGLPTQVEVRGGVLRVGDFVEVYRDDGGPEDSPQDAWVARITKFDKRERIEFKLVWMYSVEQTFLFNSGVSGLSPFERFYSHHCECNQPPFPLSVIKRRVEMTLGAEASTGYFCRYLYDQDGLAFVDIDHAPLHHFITRHLLCNCSASASRLAAKRVKMLARHQLGRFFTLDLSGKGTTWIAPDPRLLAVGQLQAYHPHDDAFSFRIFPRLREVLAYMQLHMRASPLEVELNELAHSPHVVRCTLAAVVAPCHVEFIPRCKRGSLPRHLKHRGAGNQFFFSYFTNSDFSAVLPPPEGRLPSLEASFPPRTQVLKDVEPLPALDLFSGSGSLGMGLGDSGFAYSRWAVDFEPTATEAYRKNQPGGHPLTLFTESVNTSLRNILNRDPNYPRRGQVGLVVAGTPCQGYSLLNRNRESDASLSKSSMIASLASFVDHLRPTHVLMEQIANFVHFRLNLRAGGDATPQHPFRQLLQLFLGLNYQVRFRVLSASNHGTSQRRNRIFLWCTARGHRLPAHPPAAHLPQSEPALSVAAPGNQRIPAHQSPAQAPLPPITNRDMIGDLPPLGMGPSHPHITHHCAPGVREPVVSLLERVPLGYGLADARGLLFRANLPNATVGVPDCLRTLDSRRKLAACFARVDPDGQMSTISTSLHYKSTFPSVHFGEPRYLTVRELARLQGFLDSDQLAGTIPDQLKLIGNAVPRCVAFALGLGLAPHQDRPPTQSKPLTGDGVMIHGSTPFRIPSAALRLSYADFFAKVTRANPSDGSQAFHLALTYGSEGARWLVECDASLERAAEALLTPPGTGASPELWWIPVTLGDWDGFVTPADRRRPLD
ncbi:hypothetical protein L0F63_001212 [Massospora cicadina]|nr:hypothetical protein L0F63_001212 [Massospora cicadina]